MDSDPANQQARALERLEEALWVAQAQAGDSQAFERLLRRYEQPILYYLRRLAPAEAAFDLNQEVWIAAFRGLEKLHTPEAFRVWLYQIAHRKAARFIKRNHVPEQLSDDFATSDTSNLDTESVHQALALLPDDQRELLTLFYLNDRSIAEVSEILNCPPGTVKSRLHHARRAMKTIIERKNL
jgi:RNA polymerase sigma-70 factor, ECF subfamily